MGDSIQLLSLGDRWSVIDGNIHATWILRLFDIGAIFRNLTETLVPFKLDALYP